MSRLGDEIAFLAQLIVVPPEKKMSSAEYFRKFVNERLTAAAEEIFGLFKRTIVQYEDEIDRQRRMLDVFRKPEIKLHKIGVWTIYSVITQKIYSVPSICCRHMC